MAVADLRRAPAVPPRVAWAADDSRLTCVVGWRGGRPPLAHVLPLFEHLGLVLTDHEPDEAEDSFVFAQVDDPHRRSAIP
jgi:glutamate dehydrogenase